MEPFLPPLPLHRAQVCRWWWCLLLGCLALLGGCTPVTSRDLVVERAWFEDVGGQMGWAEAREQPTQPFDDLLTGGYGRSPVWIRLRIDPSRAGLAPGETIFLRIRPAYLDEVVVHDPLQSRSALAPLGDRHPVGLQGEPSIAFVHELPAGSAPRDLWLRVQTQSARLVYPEVLDHDSFHHSDMKLHVLGTLYLGLIGLFALWGTVQCALKRERLLLSYAAYQVAAFVLGANLLGFTRLMFSNQADAAALDTFTNVSLVLATGTGVLFSRHLMTELGPSVWRPRITAMALACYPLMLAGLAAGHTSTVLQLNMALILLLPLVLLALATAGLRPSSQEASPVPRGLPRGAIWLYFLVSSFFTVLTALPALGLTQGGVFSLYVVYFYSLSSGLLMLTLLQYRAWRQQREEDQLRGVASEALALARQEQASREERERLLAMLGHELKTPLATIRMVLAGPGVPETLARRLDGLITDMAHVLERSVQASRLEAGRVTLSVEPVDLAELLARLPADLPGAERLVVTPAPAAGAAPVSTDAGLLKMILRNLLDNALKYSPPGSPVHVNVRWPQPGIRDWSLSVRNQPGRAGLPDADQVFRKYYRNPKASHQSGSGLGLFLVKGLVELLQGELQLEPDAAQVIFHLRLPTTSPEALS